MDELIIYIYDHATGQTIVRPMTAEEIAALPEPVEPLEE